MSRSILASLACFAFFVLGHSLLVGCAQPRAPLVEYAAHNASERVILPGDYVEHLKRERFTRGELDRLPTSAIILHHDDVESYLRELGYAKWEKLQLGYTDPNVMYIVRSERGEHREFIVNRGLPGAGGITTQAAELAALGVKQIIHIGTAGFIGIQLPQRAIVVSSGSIKDGAAIMLSADPTDDVSYPDPRLLKRITAAAIWKGVHVEYATGYTSPIFYLQPSGIIKELIRGKRAAYVEMEGAPLFEVARRLNVAAASIVVGSDRYTLGFGGKLQHDYFESTHEQELTALRIAIEALANP